MQVNADDDGKRLAATAHFCLYLFLPLFLPPASYSPRILISLSIEYSHHLVVPSFFKAMISSHALHHTDALPLEHDSNSN